MSVSRQAIKNSVHEIRPVLNSLLTSPDEEMDYVLSARDEVISRYQPIFSHERISGISEEDFRSFLMYSNNRHWRGLQRLGGYISEDMDLLRQALTILVDEDKPLQERLDQLLPSSGAMVPRLGRAIITAILLVVYPDKYGVWNNISEGGLRSIGIFPKFERGSSFGERYIEVNDILVTLAEELQTDLWTLDAVWWRVTVAQEERKTRPEDEEDTVTILPSEEWDKQFGLERYLQEFIRDNWEKIPDFKDWVLYEEDGDVTPTKKVKSTSTKPYGALP